ncbi:MAG: tetratricopeptide repeat protein [Terriglobia bacterium]
MKNQTTFLIAILLSTPPAITAFPAQAQSTTPQKVIAAPVYGSGASAGPMLESNFNTPESDGRPGVKFFTLAVQAYRKGDYQHAVEMYKVAASWAYKPAEYNLGVMYFKGQGVPVNRPLGAAWMVLAAERGSPFYAKARNEMVTLLTHAQFAETDKLWGQLKKTYSDKVALRRAKAQWAWVKTHQTGTRVGGSVGELRIGVSNRDHNPKIQAINSSQVMQSGSVDGSIAYHQFQESDNPYSPVFLKNRTGTAKIGPLEQIKPATSKSKQTTNKTVPPSSSQQ